MDTQADRKVNQPIMKRYSKWLIPSTLAGVVLVGITAFYAITKAGNAQQQTSQTPSNGEKVTTNQVSALGRLEPEGEIIKVASPSALGSSRVVKLMIREGDSIKEGQVMAILDSYEKSIAALVQAESQVREQENRLAQVKAGAKSGDILAQEGNLRAQRANVERLRTELDSAINDYNRYQSLYQSGATSAYTRDNYETKVRSLTQQLNQAQQQLTQAEGLLSSTKEVRPTDVSFAEAQLQTALANLKRAEIDVKLSQVLSPITGQVLKIYTKSGEAVNTNGIADVGRTQQMYAVAEVYETDIAKVKVGQKATITSEAFEGEISGKVDRIGMRIAKNDVLGTDPAAKTDVRVIEVRIRLDDSTKVSSLTNLQVKVKIQT